MDAYLGEIRVFAFGYAPQGWLPCNGQMMSVAENTALFSLIGNTYGGDAQTTFALPDFRDRAPVHQNPNNNAPIGQTGGSEKGQAGSDFITTPTLTANFCICVQGVYPPRS